ncbi:MAG TPA: hypothetical protein VGZ22_15920 [Isosphaeraceae bacterium]|nr:hypothetical protein [Isosphaeraceae bacterium]
MSSKNREPGNPGDQGEAGLPDTQAGGMPTWLDALTNGVSSDPAVLQAEDDALYRVRLQQWSASLRPTDPMEEILVARAVAASVRVDRCVKTDLADVERRKRQAIDKWEQAQRKKVTASIKLLEADPARAAARLEKFTRGCEWLLLEWEALGEILETTGSWNDDTAEHALRMLGKQPTNGVDHDVTASQLLQCVRATQVEYGAEPAEVSPGLSVKAARAALKERVEVEVSRLESLRDLHWEEEDGPDRAEVADCAFIDISPAGMKRMREETAADLDMHRNLNELTRRRKQKPLRQTLDKFQQPGASVAGDATRSARPPMPPKPKRPKKRSPIATPVEPSRPQPGAVPKPPRPAPPKKDGAGTPRNPAPAPATATPAPPPATIPLPPPAPIPNPPQIEKPPTSRTVAPGGAEVPAKGPSSPSAPRPQWPKTPRFQQYKDQQNKD